MIVISVYCSLCSAPSLPPRNVSMEPVNSTAVAISWETPELGGQNGIIASYYIILKDLQSNETREMSQLGSRLDIVVTLLHPYYYYQCVVAAETIIGRGPFASPVKIQTNEDGMCILKLIEFGVYLSVLYPVPSGPPELANITAVSSRAVYISWELPAPEHQNGIIRGFSIKVKDRVTDEERFLNTTEQFTTVNELHPHYIYAISVAAVTIGVGPYTGSQIKLPEDGMFLFHCTA